MKWFSVLTAIGLALSAASSAGAQELRQFVTRRGDELVEGNEPFRFISVNIPNLQVVEDNFAPGAATAWGWPDEFELTDAMESVRQMGGRVARMYVLSVRRAGSDMGEHVYVRGPGNFNEEAFRTLDRVIEIAGRKGVRLVIPLVDNWKWHGGVAEYAAFRGQPPEAFWTDEQVIADFETTVRHVVGRVNTRTGVPYRDDPAILGWETGNELDSPPAWTARIAALIKELDPNHLVIDGRSLHGVSDESLADPNIDVVTTHHYPNTKTGFVKPILAARERARGKKPYFVGEFGFTTADEIEQVFDAVIDSGASGALLWSLRYHHRDGGFYWHFEPAGGAHYRAYHWPGFDSGQAYEERRVMQMVRDKAYRIRSVDPPALPPPAPPHLLPIADVAAISWQGSAGAQDYIVERSGAKGEVWTVIAEGVDDTAVQYRPLFNDAAASPGASYRYRVLARNSAGVSPPSNEVAAAPVEHRTLVDEGRDLTLAHATSGGVRPTSGEDRRRREDVHRLLLPPGGEVVYEVAGPIAQWRALAFREDQSSTLTASVSADGVRFEPLNAPTDVFPPDRGDYGYLGRFEQRSASVPPGMRFLRLQAAGGPCELSRLEIRFDPAPATAAK